jgi:hypothetical protein
MDRNGRNTAALHNSEGCDFPGTEDWITPGAAILSESFRRQYTGYKYKIYKLTSKFKIPEHRKQ